MVLMLRWFTITIAAPPPPLFASRNSPASPARAATAWRDHHTAHPLPLLSVRRFPPSPPAALPAWLSRPSRDFPLPSLPGPVGAFLLPDGSPVPCPFSLYFPLPHTVFFSVPLNGRNMLDRRAACVARILRSFPYSSSCTLRLSSRPRFSRSRFSMLVEQ
mgnify:CR=1 FL=1